MYLQTRPGDSIYCNFEFDECSFYSLTGSLSQHNNPTNKNILDYIRSANLDAFCYCTQGTLYHLNHMFSEEFTTGQNLGFQIFPTSLCSFLTYYCGGLRADLGVSTRSNCPVKHEAKQKNHSPKRLGWYMQIFTRLVLLVEQHHRLFGVPKGYNLWLVPPRNPSSLIVSWLDFTQVLVNAEIRTWEFPLR